MQKENIYILGVGRNTITVVDLAEQCGYNVAGLLHYDKSRVGESYFGHKIVGCFADMLQGEDLPDGCLALSMGDLQLRASIFESLVAAGAQIPTLIHPSCVVSRYAEIGSGVQINPGSVVQAGTVVGSNSVITVNSVVAHSSRVGSDCLISGNTIIGAYCRIGDGTHIGQGAAVVSGKVSSIGSNCVLGAGSVLICDMPDRSVFVGNPAQFLRWNGV